ncbi:MAG: hypothetical protein HC821_02250 [Lewinella sp.]|nr:hypothetical protein [Lewinella sp.]
MYFKYERGWAWQQLPIETHCRLIEAFQVGGANNSEVDELRLYLLQNKRTSRWETTPATAAAVYALLQNGSDWTEKDDNQERVKVGFPGLSAASYEPRLDEAMARAEAGTGYYRLQFSAAEVRPELATVKLKNKEKTMAWGSLYWQFTQDIDAVEANHESPLQLKRALFRRQDTPEGQRLEALNAEQPLRPGERLVVQLTLSTDRDMEYIHLKDRRGSGLEPTEQLSGYRYSAGLGHYFSPDDLAVNFFFDYLPRGSYTLEYDLFVNHAGEYSNGLSVVQSMYAPEFSAYSAGGRLRVVSGE